MPRRRNQQQQQHRARRSPSPSPEEGVGREHAPDPVVVDAVAVAAGGDAGPSTPASVDVGPSTLDDGKPEVKMAHPALDVLYCQVCSFPPEYCEFGSHITKCKAWLEEQHGELYERYYSEDALVSKAELLSVEAAKKLEEETKKKEAKAEAKAESEAKKRAASKVTIKRIERNKRKHITAIHGLETFGIDLKKAAKQFAQKFATGASVTKNAAGQDEIVVQGDVSGEVEEMLEKGGGVLGEGVTNIVHVEVRGKKGE